MRSRAFNRYAFACTFQYKFICIFARCALSSLHFGVFIYVNCCMLYKIESTSHTTGCNVIIDCSFDFIVMQSIKSKQSSLIYLDYLIEQSKHFIDSNLIIWWIGILALNLKFEIWWSSKVKRMKRVYKKSVSLPMMTTTLISNAYRWNNNLQ